jgi:hypothetical protein
MRQKTGGRVWGTPNKATTSLRTQVEQAAGDAIPVVLARLGAQAAAAGDIHLAVVAFSKAASFVYARPQFADDPLPLPRVVIIDDISPLPVSTPEDPVFVIRMPSQPDTADDRHGTM